MIAIRERSRRASGLSVIRPFDPWGSPLCTCSFKYSLHPYTGCSHFCAYCYATSYIGRRPSNPKKEFFERLARDLKYIDKRLVVEMSSSSDPYPPVESWLMLTRKTIELLARSGAKILITTKSSLVARDYDLLLKTPSAVMVTITTLDEELASKLEPFAPPPSSRLRAVEELVDRGVPVGVRVDPIIPGLNDDPSEIEDLVKALAEAGVKHVVTSSYKCRADSLRRIASAFPSLASYIRALYLERGARERGYYYLSRSARERLLKPVIDSAVKHGLTVAVCRENLPQYFRAPSCDGQHLIKLSPAYTESK